MLVTAAGQVKESDLYLTLTIIMNCIRRQWTAFWTPLLIWLCETSHDDYTAPEHIYASQNYSAMVAKIKKVQATIKLCKEASAQAAQANTWLLLRADRLQSLLGGNHV